MIRKEKDRTEQRQGHIQPCLSVVKTVSVYFTRLVDTPQLDTYKYRQ